MRPWDLDDSPSPCRRAGRGLIDCPDCGREVSSQARECVHCGRPRPGGSGAAVALAVVVALGVAGLALAMITPRCVERSTVTSGSVSWDQAMAGRPHGCGFLGVMMRDGARGAEISFVAPDSPALHSGLEVGDVIVRIDARNIHGFRQALDSLWARQPGERLQLTFSRGPHTTWTIDVTLGRHPNE